MISNVFSNIIYGMKGFSMINTYRIPFIFKSGLICFILLLIILSITKYSFAEEKSAFSISKIINLENSFTLKKSPWLSLSDTNCPVITIDKKIYIYSRESKKLINTFIQGEYPFYNEKGKNIFFIKNKKLYTKKFDFKKSTAYFEVKRKLLNTNFESIEYCSDLSLAAAVTLDKKLVLIKINFTNSKPEAEIFETGVQNCTDPFLSSLRTWPLLYLDKNLKIKSCKIQNKSFLSKELKTTLDKYSGYFVASVSSDSSLAVMIPKIDNTSALIVNPYSKSSIKLNDLIKNEKKELLKMPCFTRWESYNPVLWIINRQKLFSITYTGDLSFRNTSLKKLVNTIKDKIKLTGNPKKGVDLLKWTNNQMNPPKPKNVDVNNNPLPKIDITFGRKMNFLYIAGPVIIDSSFEKQLVKTFLKQHRLFPVLKIKKSKRE